MVFQVLFNALASTNTWHTTLEFAALLLLPALGGVISERSGVVNIAMEGMMLTGAFFAVVADLAWHNPWLAALVGIVGQSELLPYINVPVLDQIPFFGRVLFQQNVVVYAAIVVLVVVQLMLFRTRLGLRIRSVGEHPQAADTAGINVYAIRYGAVITSGLLSGLAGAFLAIGISNTFVPNMTDGRGYIALAAMIFGKWTPIGAFIACLIFGLGQAIYDANSVIHVSQYLLSMLPYILTLIVLAGVVGRSIPPAADGIPYAPENE